MRRYIIYILLSVVFACAKAQISRLGENVQYSFTAQGTAGGGDNAPFWFTNNRYGLGTTENFSGLARVALWRTVETDSIWFWRMGYGVDLASPINGENGYFCIQQAYADIEWKMLRLSLGQKERPSELKNPYLSTGGLTLGMNARPLPQVRFELPDFWAIPGTRGIFSFKGHIAYGWYTDGAWQRKFNAGTSNIYTSGSMFHSKALLIRLGNRELFPLEVAGGLEMACQFGGTGWNILPYVGTTLLQDVALGGNILTAFVPGGGDVNDENFTNAAGNHIGSWHLRMDWKEEKWNIGIYMEHLFEDHSQMFMQYGFWKDMLLGVEANLPKNPFLSTIVYEYNHTMDQSGTIYHDATAEIPVQVSARDDYYNNHIYGAWQMGGFVMGNPLILSPVYNPYFNKRGSLTIQHNRLAVHHIGLAGNPSDEWAWRTLYTHQVSYGSYNMPLLNPQSSNYLLLEATYSPRWCRGLSFSSSYGHNIGDLIGNSYGAMLSVRFDGWLNRTQW
ncbi:MAG: hypothetical protein J6S05_00670 [Bacteroidaceae bacterium]|nr:hypothetical protein [Bacteroidaceae bacterium]